MSATEWFESHSKLVFYKINTGLNNLTIKFSAILSKNYFGINANMFDN